MRRAWMMAGLSVVVVAALAAVRVQRLAGAARRVERSAIVPGSPEGVKAVLRDLRRWAAWGPGQEGARAVVYSGSPAGPGASAYWKEAGGRATRLTVVAESADGLELELDPQGGPPADLELRLAAAPGGTRVGLAMVREPDLWSRLRLAAGLADPAGAILEAALAGLGASLAAVPRAETWRVERSVRIDAPPAAVRARLVEPRRWEGWSPFSDPALAVRRSYGGPREGPGATMYWSAGGAGATGRLTVLGQSASGVDLELEVAGEESDLQLSLAPEGEASRVTCVVGGEREAGARPPEALAAELDGSLARLKAVAEADARRAAAVVEASSREQARPARVQPAKSRRRARAEASTGTVPPRRAPVSG